MKTNRILFTASLFWLMACSHSAVNPSKKEILLPPTPPASVESESVVKEVKEAKKDAALPNPGTVICKKDKDERKMQVVAKGEGCELVYTKFGSSKVISWSGYSMKRCDQSRDKVWKDLEGAGFTCE